MVALGNATLNGQTIFAKNSDRPADECQPLILRDRKIHAVNSHTQCQFITIPEVHETHRHIGSRPFWCWGYEHGFNEHQVVIGNEAVHSHLPISQTSKLIGMELLRLGLERGRTASEAVAVMTDLISQFGQGKFENTANVRTYDNSYIVSDPHEAYVIETAGHDWAVKKVESALGISNVYSIETDWIRLSLCAQQKAMELGKTSPTDRFNFADAFTESSRTEGSGATRRARSCAVLSHQKGQIDVRTMMAILSDHGNAQSPPQTFQIDLKQGGICVHCNNDGTGGNTAASLVADLCADGSRLPVYWCGFYSPCLALFLPTFIEGQLPTILNVGDATFSSESPWWQFHKLSQLVRSYPEDRIPQVRTQWQTIQNQLFKTAYQIAADGSHLLNSGNADRAKKLLTDYMAENTRTMLETIQSLIKTFECKTA
jgi:dipeptidase